MFGAGGNEDGTSIVQLKQLALELQGAAALEHDIDLVVVVGLLAIRLGRHEDIDAELEAWRLVHDLVPTGLEQARSCSFDRDLVPSPQRPCIGHRAPALGRRRSHTGSA